MKVSNKKVISLEELDLSVDNQREQFQEGGKLTLKDFIKMKGKRPESAPAQIDNTRVTLAPRNKIAAKLGMAGIVQNENMVRDQGTISTYNKSGREEWLSSLTKLEHKTNDSPLVGLLTSPVKSVLKLLRPDKYFDGVNSDEKLKSAVLNMGGDVVNGLAAVVPAVRGAKLASETGVALSEATQPYRSTAMETFRATKDLGLVSRVKNAANSGTLAKNFANDVTAHNYFNMSPEKALAKLNSEVKIKPGAYQTETSLSFNSSPLMWQKASTASKEWTPIRTGKLQDTNMSGVNGKRVFEAIPKSMIAEEKPAVDAILNNINESKRMSKMWPETKMQSRYNIDFQQNQLNTHFLQKMDANSLEGLSLQKEFLHNYKPVMDAGIINMNKRSGLNFPMNEVIVDGYKQPNLAMVRDINTRYKMVGKDITQGTKDIMQLNRELKNAKSTGNQWMVDQLKISKDLRRWQPNKPGMIEDRLQYLRETQATNNMRLDDLYENQQDGLEWGEHDTTPSSWEGMIPAPPRTRPEPVL